MAKEYLIAVKPVEKGHWPKIGVAFPNQDGSINVQLECVPVDGKFQLQRPKESGG